jgi:nucleoside-diphosphate-sugar epimerase
MQVVTGGTGLVGAHLLYRLTERGERVRASYRSEERKEKVRQLFSIYSDKSDELFQQIEWRKCDLLDVVSVEELCEGAKLIFHCAAIVSFHPADKRMLLESNPLMTSILVNQALANEVEHFTYVSSVAALGKPPQGEEKQPLTEKNIWKDDPTHSNYARSKYLAEMEVWRGMEEGLQASMVNPGIILGPGFPDEGSSAIFGLVKRGFDYYTPGTNGFVDVRDVVEAMLRISDQKIHRERVILVAESRKYRWLFSEIAKAMGKEPPRKAAKAWMINIIRVVHWLREKVGGRKATITRETAASAQRESYYSNEKSKETLQIEYRALEECVRFVCSTMK